MKRFASFLFLILSLTLVGCGGKKKETIGYSAMTLTNPFFQDIADTMKAEAKKHGYELIVVSGDNDVKKQADQIDEFIVKRVSAIVINPCDSDAIGPAIKKANDEGIPVFTNDQRYNGTDAKVVSHVATDNHQGGKLAGQAIVKLLGDGGGKIAILHMKEAASCQLRVKGFKEVISDHNAKTKGNKITIVGTYPSGGARDQGKKAAQDALEAHSDLAAIFAINDPSALGAYAALGSKVDQVKIIGFDGQLIGKRAILEGKIVCDPIQFPKKIARKTIEQIIKHFNGDEVEPEILIPSKLYYKADALKDPELKK